MLVASPLLSSSAADEVEASRDITFSLVDGPASLLEEISFDDLFVGFDHVDGDILPDLEVDPAEILHEFSASGDEDYGGAAAAAKAFDGAIDNCGDQDWESILPSEDEKRCSNNIISPSEETKREIVINKRERRDKSTKGGAGSSSSSSSNDGERGRTPSKPCSKASQGKRKVDWTPELHRRFVQAVEQLGVEKAVPSRILELMGIDCLTRHNIASHLQKYRSHRKHLLAREAEAASWSHRRQMYGGGGAAKMEMTPWLAAPPPAIGFPPPMQPFRPLHVWGHPPVAASAVEPAFVHVWPPRHVLPPPPVSPMSQWAPHQTPLPSTPPYWHSHYPRGSNEGWVPSAMSQGTACYPQPLSFPSSVPVVPSFVPHPAYRPPHSALPPPCKQMASPLLLESHPPKESIDATIGEVLEKPLLSLPLGLKPPSLESVLVELQRQGISRVPPATSCP